MKVYAIETTLPCYSKQLTKQKRNEAICGQTAEFDVASVSYQSLL
jgi:hypothetical protein